MDSKSLHATCHAQKGVRKHFSIATTHLLPMPRGTDLRPATSGAGDAKINFTFLHKNWVKGISLSWAASKPQLALSCRIFTCSIRTMQGKTLIKYTFQPLAGNISSAEALENKNSNVHVRIVQNVDNTTTRSRKSRGKGKDINYHRTKPIFNNAPTTSTSSHRVSTDSFPSYEAFFRLWMYAKLFRKCLVIISGVWTPSIKLGGARWEGWTSGEDMLSMLEVINSTKLLTNLGATCPIN